MNQGTADAGIGVLLCFQLFNPLRKSGGRKRKAQKPVSKLRGKIGIAAEILMALDGLQQPILKLGGKIVREYRGRKGRLLNAGSQSRFRNLSENVLMRRSKNGVMGRRLPEAFPKKGSGGKSGFCGK